MRSSRRRNRRQDPLASPDAVRCILDHLRRQLPSTVPDSERQLIRMLESARHYERRRTIDGSRGRPRRWAREDVAKVAEKLGKIMGQRTSSRVSASSFISLYLPLLRYPTDIIGALVEGDINIRESSYLARLTQERLKCTRQEAQRIRAELLKAHLLTGGSQNSLRLRVKAMLGELPAGEVKPGRSGRWKADRLIKRNPYDARHLFYEEIQLLVEGMGQIEPDELKGKRLGEFLRQINKLLSMLRRAK